MKKIARAGKYIRALKMHNEIFRLFLHSAGEIVLLILFLIVAAFCVHLVLTKSLESAVARDVSSMSHSVSQAFRHELRYLQSAARAYSADSASAMVDVAVLSDEWNKGIIDRDGNTVAGKPLADDSGKIQREVFGNGRSIVYYREGKGMVFAVPVIKNGEVAYALYSMYSDEEIVEEFNIVSYGGQGTVSLIQSDGERVIITDDWEKAESLIDDPLMKTEFRKAWTRIHDNGDTAFFSKSNKTKEPYFIFGSLVEGTDFIIAGYVPRHVVAVGIYYVYRVLFVIYGVLVILFVLFARYSFTAKLKTKETEKLLAEKQAMEAQKKAADAANHAKSEFLSNMSHEIRTPINAVLGMNEMILRESHDANILEYAQNLQHAGVNLLGLVNDILDFSKIEAGKMEIIPTEYEVSSLLNDLVTMVRERATKKKLEFVVEVDEKIPCVLYGDEIRLKQIVTNILTNAVKYTEKGSVTLTVGFAPVGNEKVLLKVSVKDTGIGIRAEDMKKLFSAFTRIEEERNRNIEGTGLGMNITQRLLVMMNSKLDVASVYGEGSTFSFAVEQKIVNPNPMGSFEESYRRSVKNHADYREKFTAPDANILVVDDTVMNLTVVKGLLKQTKVNIDTAESGYECLNMTEKKKYDIIFLDHRMPGIDGIETLRRLRAETDNPNRETVCISLTANAVSGARETYIKAGFADYLTKPINSNHLETMMIQYLPPEKVIATTGEINIEKDAPAEEKLPEWLNFIKDLDVADGVKHCGGNAAYIDAITVFAESIESGAKEIETYFANEDWKNYTVKVHALKSTSRVIGAKELSAKARRLEDAGNAGYIDEIKADTAELLTLYRSYSAILVPMLAAMKQADEPEKKDERPAIDSAELADAYETMRDFAASFDYDNIMYVLDSLKDYSLPKADEEKISAIRAAAKKPDWDEVIKLLN